MKPEDWCMIALVVLPSMKYYLMGDTLEGQDEAPEVEDIADFEEELDFDDDEEDEEDQEDEEVGEERKLVKKLVKSW